MTSRVSRSRPESPARRIYESSIAISEPLKATLSSRPALMARIIAEMNFRVRAAAAAAASAGAARGRGRRAFLFILIYVRLSRRGVRKFINRSGHARARKPAVIMTRPDPTRLGSARTRLGSARDLRHFLFFFFSTSSTSSTSYFCSFARRRHVSPSDAEDYIVCVCVFALLA